MGERAEKEEGPNSSRADEMKLVAAEALAVALEVLGRKGRSPDGLGETMLRGAIAMAVALIERDAAVARLAAARAERRKPMGSGEARREGATCGCSGG